MVDWFISGWLSITLKDVLYGVCTIIPGLIALHIAVKSSEDQARLLEEYNRPYLIPSFIKFEKCVKDNNKYFIYEYEINNIGKSPAVCENVKFEPELLNGYKDESSEWDHTQKKIKNHEILDNTNNLRITGSILPDMAKYDNPYNTRDILITYRAGTRKYKEKFVIDEKTKEIIEHQELK